MGLAETRVLFFLSRLIKVNFVLLRFNVRKAFGVSRPQNPGNRRGRDQRERSSTLYPWGWQWRGPQLVGPAKEISLLQLKFPLNAPRSWQAHPQLWHPIHKRVVRKVCTSKETSELANCLFPSQKPLQTNPTSECCAPPDCTHNED